MSFIRVNDIFDELFAENKRLLNELLFSNKCLNVLIEIKYNFNSIIDELKTNLNENQLKTIEDLEKRYQTIESEKQQIFGNNCENNCKTSNQCFESQNIGFNDNLIKSESIDVNSDESTDNSLITNTQWFESIKNGLNNKLKTTINKNNSLNESMETNNKLIKSESIDVMSDESNSSKVKNKRKQSQKSHNLLNENFKINSNDLPVIKSEFTDNISDEKNSINSLTQNDDKIVDNRRQINSYYKCFECDYKNCFKRFRKELTLKYHKSTHFNNNQYVCDEINCNFKTNVWKNLKSHKEITHKNERRYICDFNGCNKAFKINSNLTTHKKSHSNDRPFECDFDGCNKAFKSEFILRTHIKFVHNRSSLPLHNCPIDSCNKSFKIKGKV